jgi:hypothetical protein
MRDAEILLRHIAFRLFLKDYKGNLKFFLDESCAKLNRSWKEARPYVKTEVHGFAGALDAAAAIFGSPAEVARKWVNGAFQSNLNRAILDVVCFYFAEPDISAKALKRKSRVRNMMKVLCDNHEFLSSIEQTTKSLGAVGTRFSLWGQSLRDVLGLKFAVPRLQKNRINFDGF